MTVRFISGAADESIHHRPGEPTVPVIAIIGAGPGLGAAVARRFGREGFSIALISRDQSKLDAMAAELRELGLTASGYAADVREPATVEDALARAAAELGPITALQYSPLPSRDYLKPVLDLTPELALEALQFSALGLILAARAVLPAMREAGDGSILLINGGTSVKARAGFAGTSVAFPAESAYGEMLHDALEAEGVRVIQLVIPGGIPKLQLPNGIDDVADRIWELHAVAGPFRTMLIPLEEGRE
jgi:NAD(P)-dependent dehydrogenase (short-subunit alcohol dehydrogenase family)